MDNAKTSVAAPNAAVRKKGNRIADTTQDKVFNVIDTFILVFAVLIVAYPILYIVSASFSDSGAVMAGRVWLWPVNPTLKAYETVFKYKEIMTGYRNSLFYTASGTLVSLVVTTLCAFCLSRKDFYGRKPMAFLVLFTMLFNAGLLPNYLLIGKTLNWSNTVWALIIPNCMNAWHVILMRSYFENSVPAELFEASDIDGCSVYGQLLNIALPLSGPVMAVIALYTAVGIWNSYFDALIYIDNKDMKPLQLVLRSILILNEADMSTVPDLKDMANRQSMYNLLKYAVIVVSSAPLLIMYPFVQKYFVKGIMVGSVKG